MIKLSKNSTKKQCVKWKCKNQKQKQQFKINLQFNLKNNNGTTPFNQFLSYDRFLKK
jgi:hypothetical protein